MRILFVDDEENVLSGLRRMLHPERHQWEMHFVSSGASALELLKRKRFSVVVSDNRMPGMSGSELLKEVKTRYPHTLRIVLSGDTKSFSEFAGIAHQALSKPCDPETLKTSVARACSVRDLLSDDVLRELVSRMGSLRFKPSHYIQIMNELQDEDITSISPSTARGLALSVKLFSQSPSDPVLGFSSDQLWKHSISVASCAQALAKSESKDQTLAKDAFLAGLLHDIGKLFPVANLPERYEQALRLARQKQIPVSQAENDLFEATHAEVGGYLMGLWGLAHPVVEAVAFHHVPSRCVLRSFSPLTAVHVANAFCDAQGDTGLDSATTQLNPTAPDIDANYIAEIGLEGRLPQWRDICLEVQEGRRHEREDSLR